MHEFIVQVAHSNPEYKNPNKHPREETPEGHIIESYHRALSGGQNSNLFRSLVKEIRTLRDEGKEVEYCTIGTKALGFFRRVGGKVVAQATHLGDAPHIDDLVGTVKVMLDDYIAGNIDEIRIAFNRFVNTMTQQPTVVQLVPLAESEDDSEHLSHHWDYIYEPEAKDVLDGLLTRYIEALVYQSVVENAACEQSARMVAMKSATDNAGDIIDELQLIYNKARQAAITQEISEIVGGAAAVS